MIDIDPAAPVPLYDQIKSGIRGLVARGLLRPGDPVPSVRGLSERLCVNPNTVARALRELVLEGVLESRRGAGSVVSARAGRAAQTNLKEARKELEDAVFRARRAGLSWEEIDSAARTARTQEARR